MVEVEDKYILDTLSGKRGCGICPSSDSITEIAKEFSAWVQANGITKKNLWYANIYDWKSGKHVAILELSDDGDVIVSPAPEDSTLRPFERHLTLKQKVIGTFWEMLAIWRLFFQSIAYKLVKGKN